MGDADNPNNIYPDLEPKNTNKHPHTHIHAVYTVQLDRAITAWLVEGDNDGHRIALWAAQAACWPNHLRALVKAPIRWASVTCWLRLGTTVVLGGSRVAGEGLHQLSKQCPGSAHQQLLLELPLLPELPLAALSPERAGGGLHLSTAFVMACPGCSGCSKLPLVEVSPEGTGKGLHQLGVMGGDMAVGQLLAEAVGPPLAVAGGRLAVV